MLPNFGKIFVTLHLSTLCFNILTSNIICNGKEIILANSLLVHKSLYMGANIYASRQVGSVRKWHRTS